ncbi:substrate-binding periplasmic protein [Shewanella gelidii]|uniref:ABC transporter substrate-binding protein n=1 Tax=Shewanella gelidii TaxID=1642821 RepID=A0A917JI92_9GAMM|nr:transporter substrate-binding domain-containing protein [Shewanella gelidii]MCL1096785.1 transporter substrate-binding domain-containing protein [Shewanella gelidii]GGI70132.1 ABC transporter substrate-binding protein [Shewanella gelidii]
MQSWYKELRQICLLTLGFQCCNCVSAAERKTLVANTLEYPPYEYTNDHGHASGLAIEIIDEVFKQIDNYNIRYEFYPWKRAVLHTQRGEADILFNAGVSDARKLWGNYANSVLINQTYVLFKRQDSNIAFKPDFSGFHQYSIAIKRGYLYGTGPFRQALDTGKFGAISISSSTQQSVKKLLHRRVDLFVGDYTPTMYAIRRAKLESVIDIVQDDTGNAVVLTWPTYLLFSKQTVPIELVQQVTQVLDEMKQSGRYQQIVERYTQGISMPQDAAPH